MNEKSHWIADAKGKCEYEVYKGTSTRGDFKGCQTHTVSVWLFLPHKKKRKNIASSTTFKLDPSSPVLTGLKLLVRKEKTSMIIYSQIFDNRNVF